MSDCTIVSVKLSVLLVLAGATAGCSPMPSGDIEISCGPLEAGQCREQTAIARQYVETRFDADSVRRLEFVDAAGGYTITFADGTQAGVSP